LSLPLLAPSEESELGRRARAGDLAARNELVDRNRSYVLWRARHYLARCPHASRDDLIQSGFIGLIEAANVFDPAAHEGMRFLAIAAHYVRKEMVNYLYNRDLVRIPVCNFKRERAQPTTAHGRQQRVWIAHCAEKALDPTRTVGLFNDFEEPHGAAPDESDDLEKLRGAIGSKLTPLEADVVRRRFGLDCKKETQRSVGTAFGCSSANIALIVRIALDKLRRELGTSR